MAASVKMYNVLLVFCNSCEFPYNGALQLDHIDFIYFLNLGLQFSNGVVLSRREKCGALSVSVCIFFVSRTEKKKYFC